MITEQILVDAVRTLHNQTWASSITFNLGEGQSPPPKVAEVAHGSSPAFLYRSLLSRYTLADVDAGVKWLELGEYVLYQGFGIMAPKQAIYLTEKGIELATLGQLQERERDLVYQEAVYEAFVARQFAVQDEPLYEWIRDEVLRPIGIIALDGKVDGLEAFRGEIISKIRRARYFICVLTQRSELANGAFASSVWLYQETGAAVALGKRPLILVERGIDEHFAGELQKNYEYTLFDRGDFKVVFAEVGRRIQADLLANHIPLLVAAP